MKRHLALALALALKLLCLPMAGLPEGGHFVAEVQTEGSQRVLVITDTATGEAARFDKALFQGRKPDLSVQGADTLAVAYAGYFEDGQTEVPGMRFEYVRQDGTWRVREFCVSYLNHWLYADFKAGEVSLRGKQTDETALSAWDGWLASLPWPEAMEDMPLADLDADKLAETMMDWRDTHLLEAVVKPFEDGFERLKLRAAPSTEARVLGQYFSGVAALEIIPYNADWVEVFFPGRDYDTNGDAEPDERGFMMKKHLAFDALVSGYSRYPGLGHQQGAVLHEAGQTVLFTRPDTASEALRTLPAGTYLMVLGTVGEDWLHVAVQAGMDSVERFAADVPAYGFVSSRDVGMVDNFAAAYVQTARPQDRLHLRAAPDQNAKSLGMYYHGVALSVLFDDHVIHDGFTRVRIGNRVGYMMDRFLSFRSAGTGAYLPPLGVAGKATALLNAPDKGGQALQTLEKGRKVMVLGSVGAYEQVKLTDSWDGPIGFVRQADLNKPGPAPATEIRLKEGAVLYQLVDGRYIADDMPAGARPARPIQGRVYGYLPADAEYLPADFELEGGGILTGWFFRVEDAEYDPGLVW